MNTIREASRDVTGGLLTALDEQHRAAVEAGNRTLSEAILAQTETLYEQSISGEREAVKAAVKAAKELAEAHSTLFLLRIKGAKNRMVNRMKKLNTGAAT